MFRSPRPLPDRSTSTLRHLLVAATCLTPAALLPGTFPAAAAQLPVVATPVADPILTDLAIPDTAPTQGMWSAVKSWPLNAIHMTLLPTGKLLTFGSPIGDAGWQNGRTFDVWDPAKGPVDGAHVNFQEPGFVNSFCSAMSFLADGSLLVTGGIFEGGVDKGSALLNPSGTGATALAARTANDRYYSTMISLADGRPLIMGGSYPYQGGWADPQGSIDRNLMTGMTPEVYDGGRWVSLFGAKNRDAFGPDNSRWWYSRAWVAPSGRVFGISAEKMWFLDPNGDGAVTALPFKEPQRKANSATDAPNVGPVSTAVMYDTGKILQVGGNSYDNGNGFLSSSRATMVDINGANAVLSEAPAMSFGRAWANSTVLPTGVVAVTGGSKYNDQAGGNTVLATELWDPKTNAWTLGASNAIYRGYHSSAGLMQNGTVLVSGGGAPGPVNNLNAEFYYPPYLFTTVNGKAALAPRPQIVSLSSNKLAHAQSMQIELTSQNGVSQVVLLGLTQVTHSFNSGQRRVPVSFTQAGALVTVQTPASGNLAPPGYYQLVAIDQKGVPSAGVIVALGAKVAAPSGNVTVPTSAVVVVGSDGWTNCGAEGATCTVANGPRTVRFGANGQYATKDVTGAIACTNDAFGRDPVKGTIKLCQVAPETTTPGTGGTGNTGGGTGGGTGSTDGGTNACASEGATCVVANGPRTVRFGANGQYVSKLVTGSIVCTIQAFGNDPVPGTIKTCQIVPDAAPAATNCAAEGQTCNVGNGTKTVRFGANGQYVAKQVTGSIACTIQAFRADPFPSAIKSCQIVAEASAGVTNCAAEGQTCVVGNGTKTIRFGAAGKYVSKQVTGSIACTIQAFRADPFPGAIKSCQILVQ